MNVALMVGRFGVGSGTGGVAARLAIYLQDAGHRVDVWAGRVDGNVDRWRVHALGSRWTAADRVPRGFVRLALDRVPGCEVARASGGVHRAWLAIRGVRHPSDLVEAELDRATARSARHVICNSLRTGGEVVAWHGVDAARVRVVPNGVDLDRFAPDPDERRRLRAAWGVPDGGRVALFAGHGFGRKNLDVAVGAFALAGGPADRLVVAGSDAHAERRLRVARSHLGDRLVVAPPTPHLERYLAAADALVHPSRYDSASNTVLEAMAAGVPPVVSLRDGAAERVPDRGLVVADPDRVEGTGVALRYAWGTPGLGAACAAAARGWPESRMAGAVEQILRESIDG